MKPKERRYYVLSYIQRYSNPAFKPERFFWFMNSVDYTKTTTRGDGRPRSGSKGYHGTQHQSHMTILFPFKIVADYGTAVDYLRENYTLVKDYFIRLHGFEPQDGDEWHEAVLDCMTLDYTQRFVPLDLSDPIRSDGWIGPKGEFYACRYGEHDGLAALICRKLYTRLEDTRYLEEQGWFRLHANGVVAGLYERTLTQPQLDLLGLLYLSDDDEKWRQQLGWQIEHEAAKERV